MTLDSLFPSRLTIAAVVGCAVLLPLSVVGCWNWGVSNRDAVALEKKRKALDVELNDGTLGYKVRLATCNASLAGAEASIGRQNEAIEALERAGADATARADASVREAQERARVAERFSQSILQQRPHEGESQCDAAFRLHRENVQ